MIFSRGKGKRDGADKAVTDAPAAESTGKAKPKAAPAKAAGRSGGRTAPATKAAARTTPAKAATAKAARREHGPYDVSEAPAGVQKVDLGSLQLPPVDGVEVRVSADDEGRIQQVLLVDGASALQLGVFAAPRNEGIWDEVRAEIRASLTGEGAQAEEVDGEYGTELRARVRSPEGVSDIRFVGVDGPRWMVRAVYQGAAATDEAASAKLTEVLHGLVVDRGKEAFPVREALPLRLPREIAEPTGDEDEDAPKAPAEDTPPARFRQRR